MLRAICDMNPYNKILYLEDFQKHAVLHNLAIWFVSGECVWYVIRNVVCGMFDVWLNGSWLTPINRFSLMISTDIQFCYMQCMMPDVWCVVCKVGFVLDLDSISQGMTKNTYMNNFSIFSCFFQMDPRCM